MTQARSAGILLYRGAADRIEVLLVLPGGPYWSRRDEGAWQLPKGAIEPGESGIEAAVRELREELGISLDRAPRPLCTIRQAGGKRVDAFCLEQDWDVALLASAEIEIEWPSRSGRKLTIPEIAKARWFKLADAARAILASQRPLLDALAESLRTEADAGHD